MKRTISQVVSSAVSRATNRAKALRSSRSGVAYKRYPRRAYRGNFFPARSAMPLTRMRTGYSTGVPSELKVLIKVPMATICGAGAATFYTQYMTPNSAYDPWGQLESKQASCFDQLAALYYYNKVSFAKIDITCKNTGVANYVGVGFYTSYDSTAPTTYVNAMGQPGFKEVNLAASGNSGDSKRIIIKVPIKSTLTDRWTDIASTGTSAASPQALVYTHMVVVSDSADLESLIITKGFLYQWVTFSGVKPVVDA